MSEVTRDYLLSVEDTREKNFRTRELLKIFTVRKKISGVLMKKIERSIRACDEAQDALNETYCFMRAFGEAEKQNASAAQSTLERRA